MAETGPPLLGIDEPPAYGVINPDGASDILLICEHATPRIPRRLAHLGLSREDRLRHIGWDIGALALAQALSARLDAPVFHTNYSRLVVDCNRPIDAPSLMPAISETTMIPGNANLDPKARAQRIKTLFQPFHQAIARRLDLCTTQGRRMQVIGIHSFTPVFKGQTRPWHAGILYRASTGLAAHLLACLRQEPGLVIGENEPYQIDHDDYTVPVHGEARGLASVLIEMRQDLIATPEGVEDWANRLARCLSPLPHSAC